jgi:hypothetical protein
MMFFPKLLRTCNRKLFIAIIRQDKELHLTSILPCVEPQEYSRGQPDFLLGPLWPFLSGSEPFYRFQGQMTLLKFFNGEVGEAVGIAPMKKTQRHSGRGRFSFIVSFQAEE